MGEMLSRSRFSIVTRADLLRRTVPLGVLTRYDRGCGARSTFVRSDLGHGPKRRILVVARVTYWLCDVC